MTIDTAALRKLCEKATPPPWKAIRGKPESGEGYICDLLNGTVVIVEDVDTLSDDESDAALIAAARTALPKLLDRVEKLERVATEARYYLLHGGSLADLEMALRDAGYGG